MVHSQLYTFVRTVTHYKFPQQSPKASTIQVYNEYDTGFEVVHGNTSIDQFPICLNYTTKDRYGYCALSHWR